MVSYDKWAKGKRILRSNPLDFFRFIKVALRWRDMNLQWKLDAEGDSSCIFIRFEDMKTDFEGVMRRTFDHFNIAVSDEYIFQLTEDRYSINAPRYRKKNEEAGYKFFRSGKAGQWHKAFKWYHRIIAWLLLKRGMDTIGYEW